MLKLITGGLNSIRPSIQVSIHPMLKLIQIDEAGVINLPCFNTSHVKVNQYRYYSALVFEYRFNTSHVKVNHRSECSAWVQGRVSIHPMLKLIQRTSHVKVNHRSECSAWVQGRVSIHPMLKLIQRISCIPYNTLYQIPQYLSTFLKFLPATAPFAKKIYKITAMPLFLRIHAILH